MNVSKIENLHVGTNWYTYYCYLFQGIIYTVLVCEYSVHVWVMNFVLLSWGIQKNLFNNCALLHFPVSLQHRFAPKLNIHCNSMYGLSLKPMLFSSFNIDRILQGWYIGWISINTDIWHFLVAVLQVCYHCLIKYLIIGKKWETDFDSLEKGYAINSTRPML